jgi:hypothetical protein
MKLSSTAAFKVTQLQNFECWGTIGPKNNQEKNNLLCLLDKKLLVRILIIWRMSFKFEYHGKIDFIFETKKAMNQGTRWVLLTKRPEAKENIQVYL